MARWEPDARGRLALAAMQLYGERGFEQTTVAEIAERAGVTERTFFRHFADKREVLFNGSVGLQEAVLAAIEATPAGVGPVETVGRAMEVAGSGIPEREYAAQRAAILTANPSLQERELLKLASLGAAAAAALQRRGVDPLAATLAAQTGVAVFHAAFARWVGDVDAPPLAVCIREALTELRALTAD